MSSQLIRTPRSFQLLFKYLSEIRENMETKGTIVSPEKLRENGRTLIEVIGPDFLQLADEMEARSKVDAPVVATPQPQDAHISNILSSLQSLGFTVTAPPGFVAPALPTQPKEKKKVRRVVARTGRNKPEAPKEKPKPQVIRNGQLYRPPGVVSK